MAELLEHVGARIRGYRKAAGLTQARLAAQVDLHTTYLSRIERGDARSLSLMALNEICLALGVPLKELLDVSGDDDSAEEEVLAELVHSVRALALQKQRSVLAVARKVVQEVEML